MVETFSEEARRTEVLVGGPHQHVFRFRYEGHPQALRTALLDRYRYGRSESWAEVFYPDRVRLNGRPVDADTLVQPGDEITYLHLRADEPRCDPLPDPIHTDPWLMALLKNDDVPVNPSGVFYFRSLAVHARETLGEPELTPIHRLDLETSGPVLFSRRKQDLKVWHQLFHKRSLHKRYRALVQGRFPDELTEIRGHIVPDTASRIHTRLRLEPDTSEAPTALRDLDRSRDQPPEPSHTRIVSVQHHDLGAIGSFSELELEPVTGKTNQLRVHLAHVGHPIVGDKKYHPDETVFLDWYAHRDFARVASRLILPRQALHCAWVAFTHPFSGERVRIQAPPQAWRDKISPLLDKTP